MTLSQSKNEARLRLDQWTSMDSGKKSLQIEKTHFYQCQEELISSHLTVKVGFKIGPLKWHEQYHVGALYLTRFWNVGSEMNSQLFFSFRLEGEWVCATSQVPLKLRALFSLSSPLFVSLFCTCQRCFYSILPILWLSSMTSFSSTFSSTSSSGLFVATLTTHSFCAFENVCGWKSVS